MAKLPPELSGPQDPVPEMSDSGGEAGADTLPSDSAQPSETLAEQLGEAIKGTYGGFDARFREVSYTWKAEGLQVAGSFVYPAFDSDGSPTIDLLVRWLYWRIIAFCIPQSERDRANAEFQRTGDDRFQMELHDKARSLFVRARASQKTSGEPGELLLFALLEAMLKAPQIACKMYLKTNVNVPVHGSDSIHAMVGQTGRNLRLAWGESKTYGGLGAALGKICSSISSFLGTNADEPPPRDRDIDIIRDHLNITDSALRSVLIEYLDPYSERSNQLEEMFACLVAYEGSMYGAVADLSPAGREIEFRRLYQEAIEQACLDFASRLRESGLSGLRVHFFLLPVPSINALRRSFFSELGIPSANIGDVENDSDD